MFKVLIEDLDNYSYRLGLDRWTAPLMLFIFPVTWPIAVYRFGNWVYRKCNLPMVRQILFVLYFIFKRITEILTGIEISHDAEIGRGLFIGHLSGVIIGKTSKIGCYSSFHEGVTIGGAGHDKRRTPIIGDFAYFGAGSKIIGNINLGNYVVIGANAVVVKDTPNNAIVAGVPARIINYNGSIDLIHFRNKEALLNEK